MKFLNKTSLKFIVGFLVVVLLAFTILWLTSSESFLRWVGERRVSKFENDVIKVYKADTNGGATPYETFDLFLVALENGELEQASRYFILNEQEDQKERFEKLKRDGTLGVEVQKWKEARSTFEEVRDNYNDWKERAVLRFDTIRLVGETVKINDGAGGFLDHYLPPGRYANDIFFDFNQYSKVWKINRL